MHENRETSETPAVQPGCRSAGEGQSHKARAYVSEESHGGIVPMNHSNKDGKSLAESGEGRPPIKENARQPNTYPTQSGKGVSQGLAGVRKAARENKEMKFTALLHHLTVDLLRESFYSLKRKAAPGVDGVTWQEYEDGLEDRLTDLHDRVHRGAYRATPSRRVYIEKADGRQRPLAVPAIEDKLVQHAVVTILNQVVNRRLHSEPGHWSAVGIPVISKAKKPALWGSVIYPQCGKYDNDQSDPVPNPFRPAFGYQIPIATHGED